MLLAVILMVQICEIMNHTLVFDHESSPDKLSCYHRKTSHYPMITIWFFRDLEITEWKKIAATMAAPGFRVNVFTKPSIIDSSLYSTVPGIFQLVRLVGNKFLTWTSYLTSWKFPLPVLKKSTVNTAASPTAHYCTDTTGKWHHQRKMATPVLGIFWLYFCEVEEVEICIYTSLQKQVWTKWIII